MDITDRNPTVFHQGVNVRPKTQIIIWHVQWLNKWDYLVPCVAMKDVTKSLYSIFHQLKLAGELVFFSLL